MSLPKSLTTVTTFSKLLAMILFIALPICTFYLGIYQSMSETSNKETFSPADPIAISPTVPVVDDKPTCDKDECLFRYEDFLMGYAKLKGYYQKYDAWDRYNGKVTCDSLIVTGGSKKAIREFKKIISYGNTINKIIDNKLHVNISLDALPFDQQQLLKKSSVNNTTDISFIIRFGKEPFTYVNSCFSTIDIIKVSSTR